MFRVERWYQVHSFDPIGPLTNSMQQCYSWEANSLSASQENLQVLWNPNVHYRSQEPATGPYPESDESSPHLPPYFPNI